MKLENCLGLCLKLLIAFHSLKQSESSNINGKISGTVVKVLGKYVNAYLGIPYAAPPIGDLRFSDPQPVNDWSGIYNATRKPLYCVQNSIYDGLEWNGLEYKELSEDCLYLNIWVPASRTCGDPLTTMVWIHGGGYTAGSSNMDIYDGAALASIGDVIVVSFNYRLGAFGFANFDEDDAAGNMGMLDQVMALKWIQENIETFGGDKGSITIFGESVGATSIANHLISPMTKGLFNRAILQSGSNYQPLITVKPQHNLDLITSISEELGCNGYDMLACMRNVDAIDIANVEKKIMQARYVVLGFAPQRRYPFLPENPFRSIDTGEFHDVDVLIGENVNEGSPFLALFHKLGREILKQENPIMSKSEGESVISKFFHVKGEPLKRIVKEYLGNIAEDDSSSVLKETIRAIGNGMFHCPVFHLAEKLSANNRNVFHYTFNHTRVKSGIKRWMGVPHFEEITFVFGVPFVRVEDYTAEEMVFSKKIIELWTSFAKTGKPSYEGMEEEWLRFDEEERRSLSLTPGNFHLRRAEEEKCKFWDGFYEYN